MLYLRVSFDESEIERRDLTEPLVIGRWAGCELAVRDILLSRRHCRIEPDGKSGWQVADLSSKNGTLLNGRRLSGGAVSLADGDCLKLGRLTLHICAGSLAEAGLTPFHAPLPRPADPSESLSGTIPGFSYLEPGEACDGTTNIPHRALPRPEPKLPAAYEREDVHSLIAAIASSSWDSIYAEARRPVPAAAACVAQETEQRFVRARPRTPMDVSLQAMAPVEQVVEIPPTAPPRRHPRRRVGHVRRAGGLIWIVLIALMVLKSYPAGRASEPVVHIDPPVAAAVVQAAAVSPVADAPVPHPMQVSADVVYQITAPALRLLI